MNRRRLLKLEKRLNARIIGQTDAIRAVCGRLLVAYSGVAARRGPLGVFLFAGPTGVGKTELAKALGEELFGGEKAVVRLDMSEYMEPHSAAKLIGSPPGYVGYEEEGQLTGKL
jgi:ATP-dependent Clp protease ATP-binding subunit ClpA